MTREHLTLHWAYSASDFTMLDVIGICGSGQDRNYNGHRRPGGGHGQGACFPAHGAGIGSYFGEGVTPAPEALK